MKNLTVTKDSTLIILSDCILKDVYVDGFLKIEKEGEIEVREESKKYGKLVPVEGTDAGYLQIRGYKYQHHHD